MGIKWLWCVLLCFRLTPPLFNLSFFLTFINRKRDARANKANPRDIWTGLMCGSCATMKACLQVEDTSLKRRREEQEAESVLEV